MTKIQIWKSLFWEIGVAALGIENLLFCVWEDWEKSEQKLWADRVGNCTKPILSEQYLLITYPTVFLMHFLVFESRLSKILVHKSYQGPWVVPNVWPPAVCQWRKQTLHPDILFISVSKLLFKKFTRGCSNENSTEVKQSFFSYTVLS